MKSVLFIQERSPWVPIIDQAFADGFTVTQIATPSEASDLLAYKKFDIALIDSSEAGVLDFPQAARRLQSSILLVYLSRSPKMTELVEAFAADYDEFLAYPLESVEVRLRLAARFKDRPTVPAHDCIWKGALRMAVPQQRVVQTGADGERDLELTPNEFRILYSLATRERQTLSRDQILREAWGESLHVEARTVDKHVCSLRRKLGSYSKALVSVPGKGYLFDTQLVQAAAMAAPAARKHSSAEL